MLKTGCWSLTGAPSGGVRCPARVRRGSCGGEQGLERPRPIQRVEIVAAADVRLADVDLRHGAPPGLRLELGPALGVQHDVDHFDLDDALLAQERFGAAAERT